MSQKARASLVLTKAFLEVAQIGTMGAEKYGDQNWREEPLIWSKHLDAAIRHLADYNNGNRVDFDKNCAECIKGTCKNHSGRSHLAHAAWRILALLDYELNGAGEDDLFKGYKKDE